jgi:hypothetical protein
MKYLMGVGAQAIKVLGTSEIWPTRNLFVGIYHYSLETRWSLATFLGANVRYVMPNVIFI